KPKTEGEEDEEILPVYVEARKLFNSHEVLPDSEIELKWKDCQPEQLKAFLVDEMGFNPARPIEHREATESTQDLKEASDEDGQLLQSQAPKDWVIMY
ncbi:hypothetical protein THAOC_02532, partial [Thalassiosira oceanica]